jgi:hypothetical protein
LSKKYPGDVGMASDADVIWLENFEQSSVSGITGRYNDVTNPAGMSLSADKPSRSSGSSSLRMLSSSSGANATHLYKNLAGSTGGYDEWYVRYYVKYQGGVPWHHSGVWYGGYNPAQTWPSPKAGTKPAGNDRFSIGFEPKMSGSNVQLDFYNYWMKMHSWMATPSGTTAYYGNYILQDTSVRAPDNGWVCVEMHQKLNTDMSSAAGAELDVWFNDVLKQRYTNTTPRGYWIREKFCPENTTDTTCTAYKTSSTPIEVLDLQMRNTSALKLNYLWLQNYITESGSGSLWFDDVVVAKKRIGCTQ